MKLTGGQGITEDNLTGNLSGREKCLTGGQQGLQTEEIWKVFWMVFSTPEEHSTMNSIASLDL